ARSFSSSKYGRPQRPPSVSRSMRPWTASAARRGTGPSVPALRYERRSRTGNSARKLAGSASGGSRPLHLRAFAVLGASLVADLGAGPRAILGLGLAGLVLLAVL